MAGMIMMTPDEIIEQNRDQGTLEAEELAAFGELGNVKRPQPPAYFRNQHVPLRCLQGFLRYSDGDVIALHPDVITLHISRIDTAKMLPP